MWKSRLKLHFKKELGFHFLSGLKLDPSNTVALKLITQKTDLVVYARTIVISQNKNKKNLLFIIKKKIPE